MSQKFAIIIEAVGRGINEVSNQFRNGLTAGIRSSSQALTALQTSAAKAQADLAKITAFKTLKTDTQAAFTAWKEAENRVRSLATAMRNSETVTRQQAQAFETAKREALALKNTYNQSQVSLQHMRSELSRAGISTTNLSATQRRLQSELTRTQARINQATQPSLFTRASAAANAFSQSIGRVNSSASSMSSTLKTALVGIGFQQLGSQLLDAGLKAERLDLAFKAIMGSAQSGADELEFVRKTAQSMGQEFYSSADAYRQIAAAAQSSNITMDETRSIFEGVTAASSALKLSSDETNGALRAIGQMMSKGNVQAEELRGQLGERLPGAFGLAASAMGVTTEELNKMLQKGEVTAKDMLPKLAIALKEKYGDAAVNASNSAQASINKFHTAWTDMVSAVANSGFLEAVVEQLTKFTSLLNDPSTIAAITEISSKIFEMANAAINFTIEYGDMLATIAKTVASVVIIKKFTDHINAAGKAMSVMGGNAGAAGGAISKAAGAMGIAAGVGVTLGNAISHVLKYYILTKPAAEASAEYTRKMADAAAKTEANFAKLSDQLGIHIKDRKHLMQLEADGIVVLNKETRAWELVTEKTEDHSKALKTAGKSAEEMAKAHAAAMQQVADATEKGMALNTENYKQALLEIEKLEADGIISHDDAIKKKKQIDETYLKARLDDLKFLEQAAKEKYGADSIEYQKAVTARMEAEKKFSKELVTEQQQRAESTIELLAQETALRSAEYEKQIAEINNWEAKGTVGHQQAIELKKQAEISWLSFRLSQNEANVEAVAAEFGRESEAYVNAVTEKIQAETAYQHALASSAEAADSVGEAVESSNEKAESSTSGAAAAIMQIWANAVNRSRGYIEEAGNSIKNLEQAVKDVNNEVRNLQGLFKGALISSFKPLDEAKEKLKEVEQATINANQTMNAMLTGLMQDLGIIKDTYGVNNPVEFAVDFIDTERNKITNTLANIKSDAQDLAATLGTQINFNLNTESAKQALASLRQEAESILDGLMNDVQGISNDLLGLQADAVDLQIQKEDELREMRRKGMDEAEKQRDLEAQANEKLSQSLEALKAGQTARAQSLANDAKSIFKALDDEAKAYAGVEKSYDVLEKANKLAEEQKRIEYEKTKQKIEDTKKALEAIQDKQVAIQVLADQEGNIGLLEEALGGINDVSVLVSVDTTEANEKLTELETRLDNLKKGITTKNAGNSEYPTGRSAGGPIFASAGAFIRRAHGKLPGEGKKDTVPVMARPGEWFIRNESAKFWGQDFMRAVNAPFSSIGANLRQAIAPVTHFATGGQVNSTQTNMGNYNVNFNVGNQQVATLSGDRSSIDTLMTALRRQRLVTA